MAPQSFSQLSSRIRYYNRMVCDAAADGLLPSPLPNAVQNIMQADAAALYLPHDDTLLIRGNGHKPSIQRTLRTLHGKGLSDDDECLLLDQSDRLAVPISYGTDNLGILFVSVSQAADRSFSEADRLCLVLLAEITGWGLKQQERNTSQPAGTASENLEYPAVGTTPASRIVARQLDVISSAGLIVPVLIQGGNGTGKRTIARWLHMKTGGKPSNFISLDCSVTPKKLALSQINRLNERGADGLREKCRQESACETLYLSKTSGLHPELQESLLRAIQSMQSEPDDNHQNLSRRLIVSSTKDLFAEVQAGRFSESLYRELSVFVMNLPGLRERLPDIPIIAERIMQVLNSGLPVDESKQLSTEAQLKLQQQPWNDNLWELHEEIRQAFLRCPGRIIREQHLRLPSPESNCAPPAEKVLPLEHAIAKYVQFAWDACHRHKTRTMKALGIDYRRLQRYLKKAETLG